MRSNPETIYFAGSGDWTQARLIIVSCSARTVPMSHRDIVLAQAYTLCVIVLCQRKVLFSQLLCLLLHFYCEL